MKNLTQKEVKQVAGGERHLYVTTEISTAGIAPACIQTLEQSTNQYIKKELTDIGYIIALLSKCSLEDLELLDGRGEIAIPTRVTFE